VGAAEVLGMFPWKGLRQFLWYLLVDFSKSVFIKRMRLATLLVL
jgi:hypothetical protein